MLAYLLASTSQHVVTTWGSDHVQVHPKIFRKAKEVFDIFTAPSGWKPPLRSKQEPFLKPKEPIKGSDAVMGLMTGGGINIWKTFVGSLRARGYDGHIILGLSPDLDQTSWKYLESKGVTGYAVPMGVCKYNETQKGYALRGVQEEQAAFFSNSPNFASFLFDF